MQKKVIEERFRKVRTRFHSRGSGVIGLLAVPCLIGQLAMAPDEGMPSMKPAATLNREAVVALAQSSAKAVVGEKIDRYVLQEVEFQPKYKRWRIFFQEKEPPYAFDNCFKIFVDDETRQTEFEACP